MWTGGVMLQKWHPKGPKKPSNFGCLILGHIQTPLGIPIGGLGLPSTPYDAGPGRHNATMIMSKRRPLATYCSPLS